MKTNLTIEANGTIVIRQKHNKKETVVRVGPSQIEIEVSSATQQVKQVVDTGEPPKQRKKLNDEQIAECAAILESGQYWDKVVDHLARKHSLSMTVNGLRNYPALKSARRKGATSVWGRTDYDGSPDPDSGSTSLTTVSAA